MGGDDEAVGKTAANATIHERVVSALQVAKVDMPISESDISPNVVHGFLLEPDVKFIHTKIPWNLENLNSTRNPQVR